MYRLGLLLMAGGASGILVGMFTSPWVFGGGMLVYAGGLGVMLGLSDAETRG